MGLKSMTAFGAAEVTIRDTHYRCEIKSLNSRFIEMAVRLPRYLGALEIDIQGLVKETLKRGKLDIYIEVDSPDSQQDLPQLNPTVLRHYLALQQQALAIIGEAARPLSLSELLARDGVLTHELQDRASAQDRHREGVIACVREALVSLIAARHKEGESLGRALRDIITSLRQDRLALLQKADDIQRDTYATYRRRLETLLQKLGENGLDVAKALPDERLLTEIAILTDKSDVAEELTRLATHEEEFLQQLQKGDDVGRRLDFLCQELHREVNTIASKQQQAEVANRTLTMKQNVERLRQQVQNIE